MSAQLLMISLAIQYSDFECGFTAEARRTQRGRREKLLRVTSA